MMKSALLLLAVLASVFVAHSFCSSCPAYSYNPSQNNGPAYWGSLCGDYSTCKSGLHQSPIDLVNFTQGNYQIHFDYKSVSQVRLFFDGETAQSAPFDFQSSVSIQPARLNSNREIQYDLEGFYFRVPSEHTYNGTHFDIEIQFYHFNQIINRYVAVAFFIQEGSESCDFLSEVEAFGFPKTNSTVILDKLGLLTPTDTRFNYYTGSFTFPPCQEAVAWFIQNNTISCNSTQISQFQGLAPFNNTRPLQPRNGRVLQSARFGYSAASELGASLLLVLIAALFVF